MSTKQIEDYYRSTENREVRSDLDYAVSLLNEDRIAVDCGCGAGSDIAFLRKNNFTVYAFDVEEESIRRCIKRFALDERVILSRDSFSSFTYPTASLVVADASLFFCPRAEFVHVWRHIRESLSQKKGVFCGSFLGPRDTMATTDYGGAGLWSAGAVFNEEEVRANFDGFEIVKWTEHQFSGETDQGVPHDWHIFSVVAQRR